MWYAAHVGNCVYLAKDFINPFLGGTAGSTITEPQKPVCLFIQRFKSHVMPSKFGKSPSACAAHIVQSNFSIGFTTTIPNCKSPPKEKPFFQYVFCKRTVFSVNISQFCSSNTTTVFSNTSTTFFSCPVEKQVEDKVYWGTNSQWRKCR